MTKRNTFSGKELHSVREITLLFKFPTSDIHDVNYDQGFKLRMASKTRTIGITFVFFLVVSSNGTSFTMFLGGVAENRKITINYD